METPAPVSIESATVQLGAEARRNVLRGDLAVSGSYIDNLYAGSGYGTNAESTYSVFPRITYNWSTPTQTRAFSYSPGFTFYEPTSSLNQVSQIATAAFRIRPAEYVSISVNDQFGDTTNGGPQGYSSNAAASSTPALVPAYAQLMSNEARGELTVQTGVNTIIGGSGLVTILHYPNPSQTQGLYDSGSRGASAFIGQRISRDQTLGAEWTYADYLAYPNHSTQQVQTHAFLAFYSLSSERHLSLSVAAGPQSYRITESPSISILSWGPNVSASIGWHALHSGVLLSYQRATTGGGGMLGVFTNDSAVLSTRWQMSQTWTVGIGAAYTNQHNPELSVRNSMRGGHLVSGSASLDHAMTQRISIHFQYDRSHQVYNGIPSITANPDSNQGTASLVWHFTRPLGY